MNSCDDYSLMESTCFPDHIKYLCFLLVPFFAFFSEPIPQETGTKTKKTNKEGTKRRKRGKSERETHKFRHEREIIYPFLRINLCLLFSTFILLLCL